MIIILKPDADKEQTALLKGKLKALGFELHESRGINSFLWGIVGDTSIIDPDYLMANDIVKDVKRIQEPYKTANRKMHPEDTVIDIAGKKIGGGHFQVIAGPCSIETEEQIVKVAQDVEASGAGLLRGGAFKPRTSPYSFQGLQNDGLKLLLEAKAATKLPVVTEIMTPEHLELFNNVDVVQVGARNMQNFQLLKALGKCNKTVLLKRGLANTLEELVMSAEYIMAGGNESVILCERGIRTFETSMRNTLDISAIPMLRSMTHLPIVVDPSHAAGIRWMVEPLALAAIAAGADGLMIEVHNDPAAALCDGPQSMTPEGFDKLMVKIRDTVKFFGKTMD
ncbi:MAG: 3-deoxy-7-phosphoheptulonate synthase [Firmicutes bacterium]|nr:3-deoxy-7-phosphoheptulonate synthase [Bacillota bacterium]